MQKIPGYQIIRKINQGGMSTVYLAVQLSVGREVALKVMSPALNADPVFSERFQREATIVGQLTHPNIVSIYDIGRHQSLNYIAMDYLPGGSIHDRMSTGLGLQEILRIIKEIAGALDHAHRKGYVHRDIKPENILFNENNTAILSDFGVAKTVSSSSQMTNAGTVVGTPHYMSPEQARGKPIDGRSDLYSLGVVLYEMLTGSVPYKAEEAVAIAIKHLTAPVPNLPSQYALFQPLVNKLLAKEPEDRFQCGREVIAAIDNSQIHLSGRTTIYTTTTDSQALQILGLLKALLLTTYAVISTQVLRVAKWIIGWRWKKSQGIYHRSTLASSGLNQEIGDSHTTVVSTRLNDSVLVTRSSSRKNNQVFLALLSIVLLWLAGSSALHKLPTPYKQYFPATVLSATQATHNQLNNLFTALFQSVDQPKPQRLAKTKPTPTETVSSAPAAGTDTPLSASPQSPPKPPSQAPENAKPPIIPKIEAPTHFNFTVATQPKNARVRIMNIPDKYHPGIALKPGTYQLRLDAKGYNSLSKEIEIHDQPVALKLKLKKSPIPGTVFYNTLAKTGKSPAMVIIPSGSFTMGNKAQSETAPERRVVIKQAFAVSQYEVTFADFDKFTKDTHHKQPKSNGWGRGSRPVINVTWQEAKAYTRWLAKSTGKKYRLLSEAEWEYVARAATHSDFWWGSASPAEKANCRRGCESNYSTLFSTKTAPVGSYRANPFRLFDTSGNVAEWVQDCYEGHYLGAPQTADAVELQNCKERSLRGGSIKTSTNALKNFSRDKRPPNFKASYIGFRVAVDLY